ncbi:MAG TPA: HDOD domain-containing protein [Gallionella sp.]|nr:HDOD domain-containing protein [Gallionella sp.]
MSKEEIEARLKSALGRLHSLPAMPAIAQKLLALPLDTPEGELEMLNLIEQDPQLFARVIGLANTPAMSVGRKISSLRDASLLLGQKRLKSVAIGLATLSSMAKPASRHFDPQGLWSHSMTMAVAMSEIAREMPLRLRPDDNRIFLAGFLHDIGLMALHHIDPAVSEELHRQLRLQPKRPIPEIEMELMGMTHCEIGALLARHWNLPEDIVEVAAHHHAPEAGGVGIRNPLIRLMNIAEKLLPDFGIAEHSDASISDDEWRELCIEPRRAEFISMQVNELAIQMVQLPETVRPVSSTVEVRGIAETNSSVKTAPAPNAPVEKIAPAAKSAPSVKPSPAANLAPGATQSSAKDESMPHSADKVSPLKSLLRWLGLTH